MAFPVDNNNNKEKKSTHIMLLMKRKETLVVHHLRKICGNFGENFHQVKNVFHLTQVRSPPSDCDFACQKLKMWP